MTDWGADMDLSGSTVPCSAPQSADRAGAVGENRHPSNRLHLSMVVSSVSLVSTTKMASSFAGSVVLAFSLTT
jgi:hypothetical protein